MRAERYEADRDRAESERDELQAEVTELRRTQIHIDYTLNAPTKCLVTRDGQPVFNGVSMDVLLTKCADQADYASKRIDKADARTDRAVADLAALQDRVRELADAAPYIPVHAGGGNLVKHQRMVKASELRALLDVGRG